MNYTWFSYINDMAGAHEWLDKIMVFAAEESLIIYPFVLIIMWLIGKTQMKHIVVYASVTCVLGLLINYGIGLFYYEPRPFVTHTVNLLIEHEKDFSFPSNHTTGAFTIALAILWHNRTIGVPLVLFSLLTGIARIFVGVHYPTDVLGSVLISLIVSVFVLRMTKQLKLLSNLIMNIYYRVPLLPKFLKR